MTTIFVEKFGIQVNKVIKKANESNENLEEGAFGYLKNADGTYRTIDINRMKVRMLIHDIGRWATHHPVLHETLPDLIAQFLGLKPPLIQYEFNHQERYFSGKDETVDPHNIPIEESLFHFIDFIAKRDDESNLDSVQVRRLDQLAEHAIARASGYNGELKAFWETEKAAKDEGHALSTQELIQTALEILKRSYDSGQALFYEMELKFLENILPFFGTAEHPGLFQKVGTSLEEQIALGQAEFEKLVDSGDLLAYREVADSKADRGIASSVLHALSGIE